MLYDTLGTGSKIGWTRVDDEGHHAGFQHGEDPDLTSLPCMQLNCCPSAGGGDGGGGGGVPQEPN